MEQIMSFEKAAKVAPVQDFFSYHWPNQPGAPWDAPQQPVGWPKVNPPDYTNDWVREWDRTRDRRIDPPEPARWVKFPDHNQYRLY
jgi:hypothetical protein